MKFIDRLAADVIGVAGGPWIKQASDLFLNQHICRLFTGVKFELPAPKGLFGGHIGMDTLWIADLHHLVRQLVSLDHLHIHHQPLVVVAQILPANTEGFADKAGGTITTQQVTGG